MEVEAQEVALKLANRIAQLEMEIAVLQVALETCQRDESVPDAGTNVTE